MKVYIKKIVRSIIEEAFFTTHAQERVIDRLQSKGYTKPQFDFKTIERELYLIKKIIFPEDQSFAIKLKKYPILYKFIDPRTNRISRGDEVWVLIRNNEIRTVMFRKSWQSSPPKNIDNVLDFRYILNLYQISERDKNGYVYFK